MTNPTEEMLRWELAQARRRIAELEAAASNDSALMHAELRAMASQKSFERVAAHVLARTNEMAPAPSRRSTDNLES